MENRKIVLINGDSSSWFDQAIIIVKENYMSSEFEGGRPSPSIIAKAEKIVNSSNPFRAYTQNIPFGKSAKGTTPSASLPGKPPEKDADSSALTRKAPKKDSFDMYLNVIMLVSCLVLAGVLITQL